MAVGRRVHQGRFALVVLVINQGPESEHLQHAAGLSFACRFEEQVRALASLVGKPVIAGARPETLYLEGSPRPAGPFARLELPLAAVEPLGNEALLYARADGRELTARVKAVLRRAGAAPAATATQDVLELGPVVMARGAREVRVDGEEVELTQREFDLLEYLLRHAGQVVTRAQLLESVWGFQSPGETRTVEVHVAQLRKKLGHADLIRESVDGVVGEDPPS